MRAVLLSVTMAIFILLVGAVPARAQDQTQNDLSSVNVPAGPALTEGEIIILLQAKVPVEVIQKFVQARGAALQSNKETGRKIISAGGNVALVGTISLNQKEVASASAGEDNRRRK